MVFKFACLEWALAQGLNYKEQAPDDAEFLQMMYTVRLKKVSNGFWIRNCT
jgi:hypothetical protein